MPSLYNEALEIDHSFDHPIDREIFETDNLPASRVRMCLMLMRPES